MLYKHAKYGRHDPGVIASTATRPPDGAPTRMGVYPNKCAHMGIFRVLHLAGTLTDFVPSKEFRIMN